MNISAVIKYLLILTVFVMVANDAGAGWQAGTAPSPLAGYGLTGKIPATSGKVVLIDFWASWCAPCKASFPVLDEIQKRYENKGLVVIAVNVDEQESAMEKFLKAHPVSFTIVRDAQHKLAQTAEPSSMPSSFIIDRAGVIRFAHNGFHGAKTAKAYAEEIESLLKETR